MRKNNGPVAVVKSSVCNDVHARSCVEDDDEDVINDYRFVENYNHEQSDIDMIVDVKEDEMSSLGEDSRSRDSYDEICDGDIAAGVHNDAILNKTLRRQARNKRHHSIGNLTEAMTVSDPSAESLPDGLPAEVVIIPDDTKKPEGRKSRRKKSTDDNLDDSKRAMSEVSSLGRSHDQRIRSSRKAGVSSTQKRASHAIMMLQNMSDEESSRGETKEMEQESYLYSRSSHKQKRGSIKSTEDRSPSKISFGHIHVRTYERVLGDNPCSNGPPLSIGWRFNRKRAVSIDDFERVRAVTRKDYKDMILPRGKREGMLMEIGYSRGELAESIRTCIKIKNQRRQTVHNLSVMKFEEFAEKIKRKVLCVFSPKWKHVEK